MRLAIVIGAVEPSSFPSSKVEDSSATPFSFAALTTSRLLGTLVALRTISFLQGRQVFGKPLLRRELMLASNYVALDAVT
jgi:hypothetical protein